MKLLNEPIGYRKRCYEFYASKHFNKYIKITSKTYDLLGKAFKKRLGFLLPTDRKSHIIDIACGPGFFLNFLQKEGYENARGIDASAEQIKIATEVGIKNVEQIDLFEYLPLHLGEFDMIIASHIIEHFMKDEVLEFLDLIYKSLKPGGMVLIITPNASSFSGVVNIFSDFTHEVAFTSVSLKQAMEVCNFSDIVVKGEYPVLYDFKSALRVIMWRVYTMFYHILVIIEQGTGRGLFTVPKIYAPTIYAVGVRKI